MKLYLAGPMRGIPEFNFPVFHNTAAKLRAAGYEVFSPAEKGLEKHAEANQESLAFRRAVFKLDTAWIAEHADGVALMPGWSGSKGATAEDALAIAIGLPSLPVYIWLERAARVPAPAQDKEVATATMPDPRRLLTSLLDGMNSAERKKYPVTTGVFDYFRDALLAVAHVSYCGNQKHNPGEPLHWARGKSMDEEDAMGRHLLEREFTDELTQEVVAAQLAWRALAYLQKLLEKKYHIRPPRGCR